MSLIPIPQEGLEKGKATVKKFAKSALKVIKRDKKVVGDTCLKLVQYVEKNGEMSLKEMKKLIYDMERSVIKLHKEKKKIVEFELKKLKRGGAKKKQKKSK